MTEAGIADIGKMADAIRFLAIDAILSAGEGHQGVPLGMAEIAAAVVSTPCWELFAQRQEAERKYVLGSAPRIGIEAAVSFGRERWLRPGDRFVGMAGYGASAVGPALYEHFGITADAVAHAAAELVGSKTG